MNIIKGPNGAGKTTVGVNVIEACFEGIGLTSSLGLRADKDYMIGKSAPYARIEILLENEDGHQVTVTRMIPRKGSPKLFVVGVDEHGQPAPQYDDFWLKYLFDYYLINPAAFIDLKAEDQAEVLGINLAQFDSQLQVLSDQYTEINGKISALGKPEQVEVPTKIKLSDITAAAGDVEAIKRLLKRHASYTVANLTNKNVELQAALKEELEAIKAKQKQIKADRVEYLAKVEFGIEGFTVDEKGLLSYQGRPFRQPYYSRGERLKLAIQLLSVHKQKKETLRYLFIEDFSLLDSGVQKALPKYLLSKGYQLMLEYVSDKEKGIRIE